MDEKLEVVVIPVADTGRAKEFSLSLGWRLAADELPLNDRDAQPARGQGRGAVLARRPAAENNHVVVAPRLIHDAGSCLVDAPGWS